MLAHLLIHLIPITIGIYFSFFRLDRTTLTQLFSAPFVKLDNFFIIFSSGLDYGGMFIQSLKNITYFTIIVMPISFFISMSVALMMNRKFFGFIVLKAAILLPYITPDFIMYSVWRYIFMNKVGILNYILLQLGLIDKPVIWLVGKNTMNAIIIAHIWKSWPFGSLLLLAGLKTIPKDLYEAARIDGANAWKRFTCITLSMLAPIIKTTTIIGFIFTFHSFNQFYILSGGLTNPNTQVPSIVITNIIGTLNFGIGSAMSVILMIIIAVMIIISLRMIKKKEEEI